jgi:hypothetical protein
MLDAYESAKGIPFSSSKRAISSTNASWADSNSNWIMVCMAFFFLSLQKRAKVVFWKKLRKKKTRRR